MGKRLYRYEEDRMIGGVCGGVAEYLEMDPSLVRIITVLLIFSGVSPLFYLIAWLIVPRKEEIEE